MEQSPLVSLIIPLYNAEEYCFRMMDSLVSQSYSNIQLILVNDGSSDETERIVFSYQETLEKKGFIFKYIYQQNKGVGGAINTGLKHVLGDYLCWADQDDFFEENAFQLRVEYMKEHPECAALTCNAFYMNIDDLSRKWEVGNIKYANDPKQFYHLLKYESAFCPGCHMLRVSKMKEVNPEMDIYEDKRGQNWQLLLPMYYCFNRDYLPIPIYNYIIHDGSVSHFEKDYTAKIKWYNDNLNLILETVERMLIPQNEKEKIKRIAIDFHTTIKMNIARDENVRQDYKRYYTELQQNKALSLKERCKHVFYSLGLI